MSEEVFKTVKCGECGEVVSGTSADDSVPCPKCGSKGRHFEITVSDSLQMHSQVNIKARYGNAGRPYLESKAGDDLFRKTGEWNSLERVIDRENDLYKEVISNPQTGEVIRHCEEPLSQHQSHGSAKVNSESVK
jgi:hypothetical protein